MWKGIVAVALVATTAYAEERGTAYEAMRAIGSQVSRSSMRHVITVVGTEGNPQPARWRVVVSDPAQGSREFEVANGRVTNQRPADVSGRTIDTSKLNLDSTGAYAVAAHTAETSHILFDYVNYTLRGDKHGNPQWIVTLQTANRQVVGTVYIGANKGNITRVEGMYRGTNSEQVQTQTTVEQRGRDREEIEVDTGTGADDEDENFVKRRIKQMFYRARDDAQRTFERVRQSFDEFIDRRR